MDFSILFNVRLLLFRFFLCNFNFTTNITSFCDTHSGLAKTLSILTFSIMTLSLITLGLMTLSIMTLSLMTLGLMTLTEHYGKMTLSLMALSITTHSIMTPSLTKSNSILRI